MGLNCATGPDFMTDHLRTLASISRFPVSCFPNAGLPDEEGHYHETPEVMVAKLERFCAEGWINIIGGCCGTTAEHIRMIAEMARRHRPRSAAPVRRTIVSGIEVLPIEDDRRPVVVGERTNVIGSRKFKELVVGGDLDQAAEVGRRQVRGGAQVLDVCLANPDREELTDMIAFLEVLTRKVKVPLMLDSTDARVLEEALKRCQGKAIINSIHLEDGEERFEKLERYPSIPEEERRLAEDLIFWRGDDPVAAFAAHFRGKSATPKRSDRSTLPLDERLARYIIEGSKDGLIDDLDLKLREAKPLEIINGPLMAGMDEVGRLFNNNELIVAEVLQSAEAMKAAVAHLEPFMEKGESANKGTVVPATVKGDVHDIGKNLVEIILGNNGF